MTQTYEAAGRAVQLMAVDAKRRWHQVLEQCDVTVAILFIDDVDEETGESSQTLKAHGYPAAATIAITPLKYRVLGIADALMTIDGWAWSRLPEHERMALIDHELEHIQVRAVERGFVALDAKNEIDRSARLDDHRRPVLKLRNHDWELGGFASVAKRHKSAAIEVKAAKCHQESSGQYVWDFGAQRIDTDDDRPLADLTDEQVLDGVVEAAAAIADAQLPASPLARRKLAATESEHPSP